ncbi:hypothetical protein ACE1CI_14675 [Aerosakkonemataceae cyanobacterium BLCC-F50]|uniref:Uncharacterized protein n=1 Tax=Floridaenema flaviceps BLCC-F50 TaxID=3153642 RepID=A0ABV4XSU4_9CYAN
MNQLVQLNVIRQNAIQYRQLNLTPTFQIGGNWATTPTNLSNITDNDESTATNLFQTADGAWAEGTVSVIPGIAIPAITRLKTKILIANSSSLRSFSEVAVLNAANEHIPVWANEDPISVNGKTINIDVIIPYAYSRVRYRIMDTTQYYPRMQIFDLKIFEVFVA